MNFQLAPLLIVFINTGSLFFGQIYILQIILFLGLGCLAISGVFVLSKYPYCFLPEKETIIPVLIRFQFTNQFRNLILVKKYLETFSTPTIKEFRSDK